MSKPTTSNRFAQIAAANALRSLNIKEARAYLTAGRQTLGFTEWWKDDKERRLCTLEQAIGAYIATFPGRLHPLLVELLEPVR